MKPLVATLRAAFAGVPAPASTKHAFDAVGQPIVVPIPLAADWRDLDDAALDEAARALDDMEPAAFRYFLPAVLTRAALGHDRQRAAYSLALALDLVFTRPRDPLRARARVALLTLAQGRALEDAIVALGCLDQDWARRGITWIALRRAAIDSAGTWWDHLHDRHALANDLIERIARAFDGVPPPDASHRTLYQAEAADHWGTVDRSRDALGRWQDLPDQHVLDCQWALPWLDAQGMHQS